MINKLVFRAPEKSAEIAEQNGKSQGKDREGKVKEIAQAAENPSLNLLFFCRMLQQGST